MEKNCRNRDGNFVLFKDYQTPEHCKRETCALTKENIKEIRIQYAKLANLVFKWFGDNYNLQDFYIKRWEFDCFEDNKIIIVYSDIFRITHSVDVTFEELLNYD